MHVPAECRIFLTGGSGQLGQQLLKQIAKTKLNQDLSVQLRVDAPSRIELDLTNTSALQQRIQLFQPHIILNTAAMTDVNAAEHQPALAYVVNRDLVQTLAEVATSLNAFLLHCSTDYVFDGQQTDAYQETVATNPLNIYGKSKRAGEVAALAACPQTVIVRTAWLFSETGHNFVRTITQRLAQGSDMQIVCDQRGCPTYAGDLAQALLEISAQYLQAKQTKKNFPYGIYHYTGTPACSWYEFAMGISKYYHQLNDQTTKAFANQQVNIAPISTAEYATNTPRPTNSTLDNTAIQKQFGIQQKNWQIGLKNVVQHFVSKEK